VVVTFIEPFAANRAALGFDIGSDPIRAHAIERAQATGMAQATAPLRLVQESGGQRGILLLLPVHRPAPASQPWVRDLPRGYVVGVYRMGNLMADTFRGADWTGMTFRLLDITAAEAPAELARYPAGPVAGSRRTAGMAVPVVRRSFQEAGRQWQLEVRPTPSFLAGLGPTTAPGLLVGGLLISGLLESFLLLATATERQSRRDLEQKLRTSLTAAAVAHEIKQPLATMLLHAHTIERGLASLGESAQQALMPAVSGLASDARRIRSTIDKIRDILGNVVSTLTPIDAAEPIHGALLLAKLDLARQAIHLQTHGLDDPHWIAGDREQVQLVVLNLIRNGIEAAGEGGTVAIALRSEHGWVEIEVADNGPGFRADLLPLRNPPLTSTKKEGTGIGLYVVRCAISNHRGSLRIDRSSLGGARVRLRFPRLKAPLR
jgi:signal transduction histidine kinase